MEVSSAIEPRVTDLMAIAHSLNQPVGVGRTGVLGGDMTPLYPITGDTRRKDFHKFVRVG